MEVDLYTHQLAVIGRLGVGRTGAWISAVDNGTSVWIWDPDNPDAHVGDGFTVPVLRR